MTLTEFLDSDPRYRHNFYMFLLEIVQDPVSEEQKMKDYEAGLTDKQLAEKWGKHESTVKYWRKKRGLPINPEVDHEQRQRDYESGMTLDELAEEWGIAVDSVQHWIKEHGRAK